MLYRVIVGLCGLIAATAGVYVGVRMSVAVGLFIAVTQTVVMGMLAAFAYGCRRFRWPSYIVLATAVLSGSMALLLARQLATDYGPMAMRMDVFYLLYGQPVVAFFGGYFAFVCTGYEHQRTVGSNHVRGKLVVAGMLAMALLAIVILFVAGIQVSAATYAPSSPVERPRPLPGG